MSNRTSHTYADGSCVSGYFACAMLLLGGTVAFYVLISPIVFWLQGPSGLLDALVAALLCLLPGLSALAVSSLPLCRAQPLVGMLLAMSLRMLPALFVCLLLARRGTGSEYHSFVSYLILFYLLTLAAETFLSLQLTKNKIR